jgi:hypothetical protein
MRLKNYTDIDSDLIRELIRAVRPAGISNFDVRVSNLGVGRFLKGRNGCRGRAYTQGSGFHDRANPFIVVSLSPACTWRPYVQAPRGGYLGHAWGTRIEALLWVLAHELRHLWQAASTGKRRGMVWGAKGRFSERDADAYALQMLRKFRRGELVANSYYTKREER